MFRLPLLGISWLAVAAPLALGLACGGSEQPPGVPAPPGDGPEEEADEGWDTGGPKPTTDEANATEKEPKEEEQVKEPEFTPGMTVNQAIAAVPSYYEFVGIEQEVLAKPLVDIETYKECKVGQANHFSVKIAVWDGHVVGADVDAKGNKKLAECIDGVVRKLEYKEKVKAINTVEYSF